MAQLDALPYRMYMLAYDLDKRGLFDRTRTAFVIKAAVLAELALRGDLTADRRPSVTGAGSPGSPGSPGSAGDPVLDAALAEVQRHHRSWPALIRNDYRRTLGLVETELESAGVIAVRRSRVLGLVPRRTVELSDPGTAAQAQGQFADVLRGSAAAGDVAVADAALVALAAGGHVRTVISRQERRTHAARIDALTGRFAAAVPPELAKAVRGLDRMIVSSQGAAG